MNKVAMFIYLCVTMLYPSTAQDMNPTNRSYLALGDSYTIGEGVPDIENFPHQAVQLLNQQGLSFGKPTIVAKTGWTTDELQQGIAAATLDGTYDIVSLLIGVNNQYRGRSSTEYAEQFELLLQQAIAFAGRHPQHVFVLSIPDWGATPYAEGRDRAQIAKEIDSFNAINKSLADEYGVHYIDITPGTREATTDPSLVTTDHLHPSGKEYGRWAAKLADSIKAAIGL
ncbi:SGNH/GDSL hydrolase family protein [Paraflavitalea soli]|nr:SGNH/GDSL hydrolase family protein [Paraflavitalea soli]